MKKELRKAMIQKRDTLSPEERVKKSRQIAERLCTMDAFQNANTIFIYVSIGSEVITRELIKYLWKIGKQATVPVAFRGSREMKFYKIAAFDELRTSPWGILEPISQEEEAIPSEKDLLLAPGTAFDMKRNRMGYGGGYYDTYMSRWTGGKRYGLAFDIQVIETVPVEAWDMPLDGIITETKFI